MYTITDILYSECGVGFTFGPDVSKARCGNVIFVKALQIIERVFGCEVNVKPYVSNAEINTKKGFGSAFAKLVSGLNVTKFDRIDYVKELNRLELVLHSYVDTLEIEEQFLQYLYEGINTKAELKDLITEYIKTIIDCLNKNTELFKDKFKPENQPKQETSQVEQQVVTEQPKQEEKPIVINEVKEVEQPQQNIPNQPQQQIVAEQPKAMIPVYPEQFDTSEQIVATTLDLARFAYSNFQYAIPYGNGFLYPCNTSINNIIYLMDIDIPGDMINRYPLYVANFQIYNALKNGTTINQQVQSPLMYVEQMMNQQQNIFQQPTGPIINNQTGEAKVVIRPNDQQQVNSKYDNGKENMFDSIEVESHLCLEKEQYDKIKNIVKFEAKMLDVIKQVQQVESKHFCFTLDSYTDHNNFSLLRLIEGSNKEVLVVTDKRHPEYIKVIVNRGKVQIEVSENRKSDTDKQYDLLKSVIVNVDKIVEDNVDLGGAILLCNKIMNSPELAGKYVMFREKHESDPKHNNSYYAFSIGANSVIDYNHCLASNVGQNQVVELNNEQAIKVLDSFGIK